jgi:nucleotide-binding universal stress UspA family protein
MQILIIVNDLSKSETTLNFSAQISPREIGKLTIMRVSEHKGKTPHPRDEVFPNGTLQILGTQDVQTIQRWGNPAREIAWEAVEGKYDLMIIGEFEYFNREHRFLQGSTIHWITEHAPCPVIIVKGKARPIHRILLCVSGVTTSATISQFTTKLVDVLEGDKDVTVLHVMSQISAGPGVDGGHLQANAYELIKANSPEGTILERDIDILDQRGIHPSPKVRHGFVVDEILAETQSGDYDLIVIGAHIGEKWQRLLLEDLAQEIINRVERPVLVVK